MDTLPPRMGQTGVNGDEPTSHATRASAYAALAVRLDDGVESGPDAQSAAPEDGAGTANGTAARPSEPITPELVLVDPELADRARDDLAAYEPWTQPSVERRRAPAPSQPPPVPAAAAVGDAAPRSPLGTQPRARRGRRRRIAVSSLLLAGAATSAWFLGGATSGWFLGGRLQPDERTARAQSHEHAGVAGRAAPTQSAAPARAAETAGTTSAESLHATHGASAASAITPPPRQSAAHSDQPVRPTTFAWVPVEKARAYRVEIFRGDRRIFVARTAKPRLTVPARWRYQGRRHTLAPGRYRWLVRPAFGGAARNLGKPVVRASLVVEHLGH
jgi:hypothetical protein